MKALKLNLEESEKLLESVESKRETINKNECYKNTFKSFSHIRFNKEYNECNYKVAYGFVEKDMDECRMLFRHAFIVDTTNNTVLDATACLWSDIDEYEDYNYYIFKEYKDLTEYTDAIISEASDLTLCQSTKEDEVKMVNKLSKQGLEYNPIDLYDLISKVYGSNVMQGFNDYQKRRKIVL